MRIEHQEEAARWIDTWDNNMSGRIWRCTQARLTPEQIAQCLDTSPKTVRNYQTDLHDLMNGKSRREKGNLIRRRLLSCEISQGLRDSVMAGMWEE